MDWFLYDNGLCHERVKVLNFRHRSVQNNGPVKYIVHIVIHCLKVSLFLYFSKELTQNQLDFWNLHYRFLIVVDYIKFQKISSSSRGKFNLKNAQSHQKINIQMLVISWKIVWKMFLSLRWFYGEKFRWLGPNLNRTIWIYILHALHIFIVTMIFFHFKDTINPLEMFVEKHQFFNQNNQ